MGRFRLLGAVLLGLAFYLPAQAQRPSWEAAGTLNCDVSGGIGFVEPIRAHQDVTEQRVSVAEGRFNNYRLADQ